MNSSSSAQGDRKGLFASLSGLGATLVAMMRIRVQLVGIDLEEYSANLFHIAKLTLFMLFCFGMAVIFLAILIIVIFWDDHRILVLSILTGLFMLSGMLAGYYVKKQIKQKPSLFSASLAELMKDWQSLDIHASDDS
jgi:uncharacterized membrane protein YqjE